MASEKMVSTGSGQICPEIHYRKTEKGIVITGCYGTDGQVVLPDEIDGMTVKGIADYAFAGNRKEEGEPLVWKAGDMFRGEGGARIGGGMVTEIRLPAQVTEIGRYAFYRCKNLKKLALTDSLLEIGGGAFTGCRLEEVEIHFQRGERSWLNPFWMRCASQSGRSCATWQVRILPGDRRGFFSRSIMRKQWRIRLPGYFLPSITGRAVITGNAFMSGSWTT